MPYFKWRGVDMLGSWHSGKEFAKSTSHLDKTLLDRGVALLQSKPMQLSWLSRTIKPADTVNFFKQLSVLIDAGMLLPQALALVGNQLNNPRLQEVVHRLADNVHEGIALSTALSNYRSIFDPLTIQQIRVGEESGELAAALNALSKSHEIKQDFHSRIRSALTLPLITLLFFFIIAAIIFVFVIPRFAELFAASRQEIPPLTRTMLQISKLARSWYSILIIAITGGVIWSTRLFSSTTAGKGIFDRLWLSMPFISRIVRYHFLALFFQSLAMLLKGGMRLVPALNILHGIAQNHLLQEQIALLAHEIESGSSLSSALARQPGSLFTQDAIALVTVGEESGQLVGMLQKVANLFQQRVHKELTLCTVLLQPLLMILLGLLVTALIFSVYGPIFNLANVINV